MGDSISAGYGLKAEKGWVTLLQLKLQQENQPYTIFNESISGDTTAGGLARIDKALSRYKPEFILLELGANDGLRGLSPKKMKSNLAEIISRSHKAGAKVLLLSMRIPPNYGKRYVDMFYNVYPQLAEELDIPFVPFILEDIALAKELMQKDGLHPNAKAQPLIADKIWQHLHPILEL
jgi:acyl-CoA thioesterase-1